MLRRRCGACGALAMRRTLSIPVPSLRDLMEIVLWPEQQRAAREHQALLPELEAWLPGGDAYLESVAAQLHTTPASGFT